MKNSLLCMFVLFLGLSSCQKEETEKLAILQESPQIFILDTLKSGVVVEKRGNSYFWLGDIMLSPAQLKSLGETGTIFDESKKLGPETVLHPVYGISMQIASKKGGGRTSATGMYPTSYNLWAMVRYTLHPSLTWDRLSIIQDAIAHWEATTNVRFYNATGEPTTDPVYGFQYPYIEFVNGTVNTSYIGRIGGRQEINLAQFQGVRAAVHEIGHAIGLLHEQIRTDRDNNININFSNIKTDAQNNFQKRTSNFYIIGSFDFESVMLYGSFISDLDMVYDPSVPVLTRKDGSTWEATSSLSDLDRQWANSFYLPYKAREDSYLELDDVVYKPDNTVMTPEERLDLQASLNNGNPIPPSLSGDPLPPDPPIMPYNSDAVRVYRYYSGSAGDHYYTSTWQNLTIGQSWNYESIEFYALNNQLYGSTPVYRYWNNGIGDHYYTPYYQGNSAGDGGWLYETIAFYAFNYQALGTVPVYSYWSSAVGNHFYTTTYLGSSHESGLYQYESIAFYAYPAHN